MTEQNVPIPPSRHVKYDCLDSLAIGESWLFTEPVNKSSLKSCIQYRQIRYNKKFTLRVTPEGFIRVWRVS